MIKFFIIRYEGKNFVIKVDKSTKHALYFYLDFKEGVFHYLKDFKLIQFINENACDEFSMYPLSFQQVEVIRKTINNIKKFHKGQTDKAGNEYYLHPVYVASIVDGRYYELLTALLHDVVEDTGVSLFDLEVMGYPYPVIEAVDAISRRQGESRDSYIERVNKNFIAKKVKLADLTHNMMIDRIPNPTNKDFEKREKYKEEYKYLKGKLDMKTVAKFEKVSREQWEKDNKNVALFDVYDDIKLPKRATKGSAGYDFFSPITFELQPHSEILFKTGIRCRIDNGYVLKIYPRSGLGFKYGLRLANTVGIIDSDYYNAKNEGHIACKLYNPSDKPILIEAGDAFAQGVFVEYFLAEEDEVTTERVGGFGSTTKKEN